MIDMPFRVALFEEHDLITWEISTSGCGNLTDDQHRTCRHANIAPRFRSPPLVISIECEF